MAGKEYQLMNQQSNLVVLGMELLSVLVINTGKGCKIISCLK
jgi:hypothetical protein